MGIILGCDPGAKGAFCLLMPNMKDAWFFPTPGGVMSPGVIFSQLQAAGASRITSAAIEDVHSLYGMSAKSNFSFGGNVQSAATLLEILLHPNEDLLTKVQPKEWQKAVGITAKGKDIKTAVARIACELYPFAYKQLYGPKGGLIDGRADALMIAHYAYLQEQSNEQEISKS